jgi:zinc transporter, ZIP family
MAEFEVERHLVAMSPSRWLSLFIATGIGLHNFSEGLAIGQSAARDELSLALVLIIGFGLHNATEAFGIVAPLAGDKDPPSWRFLGMLGLIGGGPTFVGTLVGQTWASEALSVAFLALAAGSILYVVTELIAICRSFASKELVLTGILVGLVLGFATDFVLIAAGA